MHSSQLRLSKVNQPFRYKKKVNQPFVLYPATQWRAMSEQWWVAWVPFILSEEKKRRNYKHSREWPTSHKMKNRRSRCRDKLHGTFGILHLGSWLCDIQVYAKPSSWRKLKCFSGGNRRSVFLSLLWFSASMRVTWIFLFFFCVIPISICFYVYLSSLTLLDHHHFYVVLILEKSFGLLLHNLFRQRAFDLSHLKLSPYNYHLNLGQFRPVLTNIVPIPADTIGQHILSCTTILLFFMSLWLLHS